MSAVRLAKSILPILAAGWNVACAQDGTASEFEYLRLDERSLVVTHSLALRFDMPAQYTVHPPTHRAATFNNVPFEISLSAFVSPLETIMVHAEQVADGSGAANYDRFPPSNWPITEFRSPGPASQEVPASVVAEEHDLLWLRERGFEPSGSIWMEQHFLSGNDYNDEIVVTLLIRGLDCEDGTEAVNRLTALKAQLTATH